MAAFSDIPKIVYEGPNSDNPLAFRWYNPEENTFVLQSVTGTRSEPMDQIRLALRRCNALGTMAPIRLKTLAVGRELRLSFLKNWMHLTTRFMTGT